MNLRHFILSKHSGKSIADDEISSENGGDEPPSYYYLPNALEVSLDDKSVEPRREGIQRIPTFAVFHKLAPGKGIPHTFVGESYLSLTTTKRLIHVSR
jgi:KUP system potassium uptake protein